MSEFEQSHIANLSRDGFFRLELGRGIVWMNDGLITMTGFSRQDLLDRPRLWRSLFSEKSVKEILVSLEMFISNPDFCLSLPLEMRVKDGGHIWVEITLVGTIDEGGACNGVEGYARDVTEHVRVAELLSRKTQEQRVLLQVQRELLGELDLPESLNAIVRNSLDLFDATDATLFLLEEDGITLRPVASSGPAQGKSPASRAKIGEGITGWVADKQEPMLLSHRSDFLPGIHRPGSSDQDESIISAPLVLQDRTIGVLLIEGPPEHFDEEALRVLVGLAQVATLAVANSQMFSAVQRMAEVDELTGAFSRNYFDQTLREELKHARNRDYPVSVLMIDIDNLKPINDGFGHMSGDQLLVSAVAVIKKELRDVDWVARIGGDEFAVVLPGCPINQLGNVARKLQHALRDGPFIPAKGHPSGIHVSIGGTSFPEGAGNMAEILVAIDQAELKAKHAGGNQFVLHSPQLPA